MNSIQVSRSGRSLLLLCAALVLVGAGAFAQIPVTLQSSYFEDFENGDGGYSTGGSLWERGTPAQGQLSSAYSGTQAWMTRLAGNYPNNRNELLTGPTFDFSTLVGDPVITMAINYRTERVWDGCQFEINDGSGWRDLGTNGTWYNTRYVVAVDGPGWSNSSNGWVIVTHVLTGTAGKSDVGIRLRFGSDSSNTNQGFAVDDIRIEAQNVAVDAATPYREDFESGNGIWSSDGLWHRAEPAGSAVQWANSGRRAFVTDHNDNYGNEADFSVTSRLLDFRNCSEDPMLSMAVNYSISTGGFAVLADGFRVEIDRNDGSGFVQLGSVDTWYNTSYTCFMGGDGWSGNSGGWTVVSHRLNRTAGNANVKLRVRFSSGYQLTDEGAAFDDVSISCLPADWNGTQTLNKDDLTQMIAINGVLQTGFVHQVNVNDTVRLITKSPKGTFAALPAVLMAEHFSTAGPAPVLPGSGICLSHNPATTFPIIGGLTPGSPVVLLPTEGFSFQYQYPGGLSGTSAYVQAASLTSGAGNGAFASTDLHELRYQ